MFSVLHGISTFKFKLSAVSVTERCCVGIYSSLSWSKRIY